MGGLGTREREILYWENTVCERGWVGLYVLWSLHREDGIDMRERNIIHVELIDLLCRCMSEKAGS